MKPFKKGCALVVVLAAGLVGCGGGGGGGGSTSEAASGSGVALSGLVTKGVIRNGAVEVYLDEDGDGRFDPTPYRTVTTGEDGSYQTRLPAGYTGGVKAKVLFVPGAEMKCDVKPGCNGYSALSPDMGYAFGQWMPLQASVALTSVDFVATDASSEKPLHITPAGHMAARFADALIEQGEAADQAAASANQRVAVMLGVSNITGTRPLDITDVDQLREGVDDSNAQKISLFAAGFAKAALSESEGDWFSELETLSDEFYQNGGALKGSSLSKISQNTYELAQALGDDELYSGILADETNSSLNQLWHTSDVLGDNLVVVEDLSDPSLSNLDAVKGFVSDFRRWSTVFSEQVTNQGAALFEQEAMTVAGAFGGLDLLGDYQNQFSDLFAAMAFGQQHLQGLLDPVAAALTATDQLLSGSGLDDGALTLMLSGTESGVISFWNGTAADEVQASFIQDKLEFLTPVTLSDGTVTVTLKAFHVMQKKHEEAEVLPTRDIYFEVMVDAPELSSMEARIAYEQEGSENRADSVTGLELGLGQADVIAESVSSGRIEGRFLTNLAEGVPAVELEQFIYQYASEEGKVDLTLEGQPLRLTDIFEWHSLLRSDLNGVIQVDLASGVQLAIDLGLSMKNIDPDYSYSTFFYPEAGLTLTGTEHELELFLDVDPKTDWLTFHHGPVSLINASSELHLASGRIETDAWYLNELLVFDDGRLPLSFSLSSVDLYHSSELEGVSRRHRFQGDIKVDALVEQSYYTGFRLLPATFELTGNFKEMVSDTLLPDVSVSLYAPDAQEVLAGNIWHETLQKDIPAGRVVVEGNRFYTQAFTGDFFTAQSMIPMNQLPSSIEGELVRNGVQITYSGYRGDSTDRVLMPCSDDSELLACLESTDYGQHRAMHRLFAYRNFSRHYNPGYGEHYSAYIRDMIPDGEGEYQLLGHIEQVRKLDYSEWLNRFSASIRLSPNLAELNQVAGGDVRVRLDLDGEGLFNLLPGEDASDLNLQATLVAGGRMLNASMALVGEEVLLYGQECEGYEEGSGHSDMDEYCDQTHLAPTALLGAINVTNPEGVRLTLTLDELALEEGASYQQLGALYSADGEQWGRVELHDAGPVIVYRDGSVEPMVLSSSEDL